MALAPSTATGGHRTAAWSDSGLQSWSYAAFLAVHALHPELLCWVHRHVCRCRADHAEAEVKALQKQIKEMHAKAQSSTKELDVLNELNRSLITNQQAYKDKLTSLAAASAEKDRNIVVRTVLHGL